MNTRLVTRFISDMSQAPVICGEWNVQNGEKITPVVFVPSRNACKLYFTIPEGFFCVATSYESYVGIWGAGFHVAKPWHKISHMVTGQYIVYDTPVKECPTADNVMVEVDVSVVFNIEEAEHCVKDFVYKLGPERLESMLKAFQEEAVRTMARQKRYSSIYDLMDTEELTLPQEVAAKKEKEMLEEAPVVNEMRAEQVIIPGQEDIELSPVPTKTGMNVDLDGDGKIACSEQLENTKRAMNDKFQHYGVKIYSMKITNVVLPGAFRHQMEEATTFESKNIRAAAQQSFELMKINDNERKNQKQQALTEEIQEAISKNEQRIATEMKITNLFEAGTRRIIADIQEKMNADVRSIQAESALKVSQIDKAKEIELANIDAEAHATVLEIRTEMDAFVTQARADAKSKAAENNAQALGLMAAGERSAASNLVAQRDFAAKMSNLRVLKNMALNDNVCISGKNTDSVVAQLMAAKNSALALGVGNMM